MTWYNCLWRMNNRTDINDVSIQIQHYYLYFAMRSYAGILNDKTIANELMYIPNYDTQNYQLCRLQLVEETF